MWRKPQGYARISAPDGNVEELHTRVCGHCQKIDHIKPKQDPASIGGLCYVCMRLICPACVGKGCDEIQRKLDRWEASHHARRSYGLVE